MAKSFFENNFFRGKKVFVTGHTGFKGAWLSFLLNRLGCQVSGYALESHTAPNLFNLLHADEFVNSHIADIRNFDALKNVLLKIQPDIIVHMAAQSLVRTSYKSPRLTYETNVMGTVNLLEAARAVDKTKVILNVTTDKCYENKEWDRAYHENDPLGGHDPYSSSKASSELVSASYRRSFFETKENDIKLATARSGNIIGGGDWSVDRLIPDFIRSKQTDGKMVIRNKNATRPWQYILDSLFGYLLLIEKLYNEGSSYAESWNFGPDEKNHKSVGWIVNHMSEKWGDTADMVIDKNENVHESKFLKLNSEKAKSRLGWSNAYSLEKSLDSTVDWYKRYFNNENPRKICEAQINEFLYEC